MFNYNITDTSGQIKLKGRVLIMAKTRFRRRPNNSGTVVKLSGNRSRPFMAKITVGYDDLTGKIKQKPIGYFENRQEALDALTIYNLSNKKEIDPTTLKSIGGDIYETVMSSKQREVPTFQELFDNVFDKDITQLTKSRQGAYKAAFKHLVALHNLKITDIDLFKMQSCIDISKEKVGSKVLNDMKTICVKIFEYAVIHQLIDRNSDFTSYLDASKKEAKSTKHKPFTIDEIKLLIQDDSHEARMALIFIFSGARPIELLNINTDNIFIDVDGISYMITGSKTEAGKNRIIPIHNFIKPFIIDFLKQHKDYLLISKRNIISQSYNKNYFSKLMDKLNLNHTPYDTRHTFATLAKMYRVDEFSRKRIMGHKSQDLTDDVYTHTFKEELFKEINKIKIE